MNELVTVVVPIYNVERYLVRCVESIVNQTYHNLEIILVDDGSPDKCPEICDDFAKNDDRIKVIHKVNEGLGMARNTGIDNAKGKYICFFDSDDYIEPDTIEFCVKSAVENKADLVIFGHDDVTNDGKLLGIHTPCPPKQLFSGQEIIDTLLPVSLNCNQKSGDDWNTSLCAWNKLYSLEVIKESGWRFASEREIISEDYYSLTELHKNLNSVFITDRVFYHYVVNESSLSRTFKADRFERIKGFYKSMISLSENMESADILKQPINNVTLGFTIGAMKHIVNSNLSFCNRYRELKKIVKDEFLQDIIKDIDFTNVGSQKKMLCKAIKSKFVFICFLFISLK